MTDYLPSELQGLKAGGDAAKQAQESYYSRCRSDYGIMMANFQRDADKQTDDGFHPFSRLQSFNAFKLEREVSHVFIEAKVWTIRDPHKQQQDMTVDEIDAELLEQCKPFWEIAEGNFKGKFHISAEFKRDIRSSGFDIKLKMHMSKDDLDTFLMYLKLSSIGPSRSLTY